MIHNGIITQDDNGRKFYILPISYFRKADHYTIKNTYHKDIWIEQDSKGYEYIVFDYNAGEKLKLLL
jgi:hypothetical protein